MVSKFVVQLTKLLGRRKLYLFEATYVHAVTTFEFLCTYVKRGTEETSCLMVMVQHKPLVLVKFCQVLSVHVMKHIHTWFRFTLLCVR